MSSGKDIYDLTIIDSGPIGLSATLCAGIRKAKTEIIDSLPRLSGQLTMLYPEKYIHNISGFPVIEAGELIANLEKRTQPLQHDVCLEEEVAHLTQEAGGLLRLDTARGTRYSKAVISTTGNDAFQPRRLATKNTEIFEGESIHYYVTDMKKFAGKKIAVAGGDDPTIDWTLMLESVVEEVPIIHRRPQLRGHEHSVEQLEKSSVSIRAPYIISDILKENETFTGVQLTETKGDQTSGLPLNDLIISYGFTSSLAHLKEQGLDISRNAVNVHSSISTNIPDVYAIGDICSYEGKVKLIVAGFGEAPTAVNSALHYLRPDARCQPVHGTSLFENGVSK